jgi:hypothetical protein
VHAFSALARVVQLERDITSEKGGAKGEDKTLVRLRKVVSCLGIELSRVLAQGAASSLGAQVASLFDYSFSLKHG